MKGEKKDKLLVSTFTTRKFLLPQLRRNHRTLNSSFLKDTPYSETLHSDCSLLLKSLACVSISTVFTKQTLGLRHALLFYD